jgi:hypothetical protein
MVMSQQFKFFFFIGILLSSTVRADIPNYFTKEIDNEYRNFIKHIRGVLPKTDLPLAYLPSLEPFNLLDVRPLKFKNDKNKQSFANFNFGVFGRALLNINEKQLSHLPSVSICKNNKCKTERLKVIRTFLLDASSQLRQLNENKDIFIVQQTGPQVYRVNNTFYSPATLITYFPSEHAGFVPSGNFEVTSKLADAPKLVALSTSSNTLRTIMEEHKVAAIAKIDETSTNIIFGGLGDNHWGVVIEHYSALPKIGAYNNIGLEYDTIEKLSANSFYYQTN